MNFSEEVLQVLYGGLSRIGVKKELRNGGTISYMDGWVSSIEGSDDGISINFSFDDGSPDERVQINSPELGKYIITDRDCVLIKRRDPEI